MGKEKIKRKQDRKCALSSDRSIQKDNIKTGLKEMEYEDMNRIHLVQDRTW
jgi:hypothetical protein